VALPLLIKESKEVTMKKYTILFTVLLFASGAMAFVSTTPGSKEYRFKFSLKAQSYENVQKAGSWDEAFERAAQACFSHFKGGRKVAEEQGLDIIDACANPRSI
jgi:hypothetical protein